MFIGGKIKVRPGNSIFKANLVGVLEMNYGVLFLLTF